MHNRILHYTDWLDDHVYETPIPSLGPATTLDEIILLEPEVARVLQMARSVRKPDWHHYTKFKRRLACFVGWFATDDRLKTELAYDIALRAMVDELGI